MAGSLHEAVAGAVPPGPRPPVRESLATAARILAADGHVSGLAGQVSARGPVPDTYWTLPLGVGLDEARPGMLVLVDGDLNTLEGSGRANPATRFHLWVYRARPDLNAIVHTHPLHASALAAAAVPLVVAHMDSAPLFEDCGFLPEWPGVPFADREGEIIAGALGGRHALLLAHHGILAAGKSVEEASFLAVFMERTARLQLLAQPAGGVKPLSGEEPRKARDFLRTALIVNATFDYWARRL